MIFSDNLVITRPWYKLRSNLPYPNRLQHALVEKSFHDCHSDVCFVHLVLEGLGEQAVAQLFLAVHHILGDSAPVVSAPLLPGVESLGLDFLGDGVAGMVVSLRNRIVDGREW